MQEFFLGHSVLIGESKTFQFQMYICDILVAHLNQRSGTAFLDHWVMYVFLTWFPFRNMLSLYGVWESAQLLCDDPFTCHLFLFFAPSPGNRGHTLSSFWVRRVVFQLMQLQIGCHCARILHAFSVGFPW